MSLTFLLPHTYDLCSSSIETTVLLQKSHFLTPSSTHPQLIGGCPAPIKVMVATQIGGNKEEITHEELVRLYIKTPPDYNQDDIKDHFNKYGAVEYVTIIRDKTTNKSKGVAFVKFFR